jgi:mannose-6-phosphate isomerase-like protein (cupin superfamily)
MRSWNLVVFGAGLIGGTLLGIQPRVSAQDAAQPPAQGARGAGRGGAGRGGARPAPEEVWAPQPVPETPFTPPNRLIWKFSEIVASHEGQPSWHQEVVKTRDFEAEYIQIAPGEKTKTMFYADDRIFWWIASGQLRFHIRGQEPFVATKGFLVQVAPDMEYTMEAVGNEPALRFEVRPAGEMPSYAGTETPTPIPGWKFVKVIGGDIGKYAEGDKPYLDFNKDVVEANAGSSNFVYDGHTSAHIIRGRGAPTPPDTNWGHFHENMVEFWVVIEGQLDFLISGEKLVTGDLGDVVFAPNERWHRATFHGTGMATRLAITPRLKEGQVHYMQINGGRED